MRVLPGVVVVGRWQQHAEHVVQTMDPGVVGHVGADLGSGHVVKVGEELGVVGLLARVVEDTVLLDQDPGADRLVEQEEVGRVAARGAGARKVEHREGLQLVEGSAAGRLVVLHLIVVGHQLVEQLVDVVDADHLARDGHCAQLDGGDDAHLAQAADGGVEQLRLAARRADHDLGAAGHHGELEDGLGDEAVTEHTGAHASAGAQHTADAQARPVGLRDQRAAERRQRRVHVRKLGACLHHHVLGGGLTHLVHVAHIHHDAAAALRLAVGRVAGAAHRKLLAIAAHALHHLRHLLVAARVDHLRGQVVNAVAVVVRGGCAARQISGRENRLLFVVVVVPAGSSAGAGAGLVVQRGGMFGGVGEASRLLGAELSTGSRFGHAGQRDEEHCKNAHTQQQAVVRHVVVVRAG
mmetsp:Transcript_2197/g.5194  ORF Transcript_2197/g.5194 Transcript_2197/m.5194 type:complete len:409 (+) Transcript_2197:689-1915(+)